MMRFAHSTLLTAALSAAVLLASQWVGAHGEMTPQAVNTDGLKKLGEEWLETNPYSGNKIAIEIGASAYNQNCARCHGLEGISGGIAPDLRALEPGIEGDEWYVYRVRKGATRNGIPYMPKFEGVLSQEALWTIRAWLETRYDPNL